jgi:hypothetical protein
MVHAILSWGNANVMKDFLATTVTFQVVEVKAVAVVMVPVWQLISAAVSRPGQVCTVISQFAHLHAKMVECAKLQTCVIAKRVLVGRSALRHVVMGSPQQREPAA